MKKLSALLLLTTALLIPRGQAANFNVAAGDTAGLITAITTANANSMANTIDLAPGAYTFSAADNFEFGPNALPQITSDLTLNGHGATLARGAGAPKFRFFYVAGNSVGNLPAGHLTLTDLTLQGGLAKGGDSDRGGGGAGMGGAIFNHGQVTLTRVTLTANTAQGGRSGVVGLALGGGGIGGDAFFGSGGGFGGAFKGQGGSGGSGGGHHGGGGGAFVRETMARTAPK